MLSFKEARDLQITIRANKAKLRTEKMSFKDARALQVVIRADVARLRERNEKPKSDTPLLDALVAGKHDNEPPLRFLARVEAVVKELSGDFEPVKEPMIKYTTSKLAA